MSSVGRNLRVELLALRLREARHYYVNLLLLPANKLVGASVVCYDKEGASTREYAGRTEMSDVSSAPRFENRCFLLRVPQEGSAGPGCVLRAQLFEAQTGGDWNGPSHSFSIAGYHDFLLQGEVVRRLLRGDHVKMSAKLSSSQNELALELLLVDAPGVIGTPLTAPGRGGVSALFNAVDTPPTTRGASPGGGRLNSKSFLTKKPGEIRGGKGGTKGSVSRKPIGARPGQTRQSEVSEAGDEDEEETLGLHVFVAWARGLPSVLNPLTGESDGVGNVFVACKSARQAAEKLPAQATTVSLRSREPVWNKLLTVDMYEHELDQERLLMALVNADSNKLVAKAALPVSRLNPGHHYNLHLVLGEAADGQPAPEIFVTLCLSASPATNLRFIRANADLLRLEAGITSLTLPEGAASVTNSNDANGDDEMNLAARWSVAPDSAAVAMDDRLPPPLNMYTTVEVFDEVETFQSEIAAINAGYMKELLPLHGGKLNKPFWPEGHTSLLHLTQTSMEEYTNPGILLELHRFRNGPEPAIEPQEEERDHEDGPSTLVGRAVVPLSELRSAPRGQPLRLDAMLIPAGGAPPPSEEDAETESADKGGSEGSVGLEIRFWGPREFLEQCELEVAPLPASSSSQRVEETVEGVATEEAAGESGKEAGVVVAHEAHAQIGAMVHERLDNLCDDMRDKQSCILGILASTDTAQLKLIKLDEENREKGVKVMQLEAGMAELRRLLHEEKQGAVASEKHLQSLPHDAVVKQAVSLTARYNHSLRQNQELVQRLQQMHDEMIRAKALRVRHGELQEAHAQQNQRIRKMELLCAQVGKFKDTVRSQEGVIARLEKLLEKAVQERRTGGRERDDEEDGDGEAAPSAEGAGSPADRAAEAEALLREENENLAQQNELLTQSVEALTLERDAANQQLQAVKDDTATSAAEHQQLSQEHTELQGEVAELKASVEKLTQELDTAKEETESLKQNGDKQKEEAYQQTENLKRQAEELQQQKQELESQKEELARTKDEAERRSQELEQQRKEADDLKSEIEELRQEKESVAEKLASLKEELEESGRAREDGDDRIDELEQQKLELLMRAESAETKAKAQSAQLLEASKRSAQEVAKLKTKLAEKDAQLMGGFGDFSKLPLGEGAKGVAKPVGKSSSRVPEVHKSGAKKASAPSKLPPMSKSTEKQSRGPSNRPPSAQSAQSSRSGRPSSRGSYSARSDSSRSRSRSRSYSRSRSSSRGSSRSR